MPKTKRACAEATVAGLQHWFTHVFEQLGWMILAHKYGYTDKINTYKKSIDRMQCALEKKIGSTHDSDVKKDLMIMLENSRALKEHVHKDF